MLVAALVFERNARRLGKAGVQQITQNLRGRQRPGVLRGAPASACGTACAARSRPTASDLAVPQLAPGRQRGLEATPRPGQPPGPFDDRRSAASGARTSSLPDGRPAERRGGGQTGQRPGGRRGRCPRRRPPGGRTPWASRRRGGRGRGGASARTESVHASATSLVGVALAPRAAAGPDRRRARRAGTPTSQSAATDGQRPPGTASGRGSSSRLAAGGGVGRRGRVVGRRERRRRVPVAVGASVVGVDARPGSAWSGGHAGVGLGPGGAPPGRGLEGDPPDAGEVHLGPGVGVAAADDEGAGRPRGPPRPA